MKSQDLGDWSVGHCALFNRLNILWYLWSARDRRPANFLTPLTSILLLLLCFYTFFDTPIFVDIPSIVDYFRFHCLEKSNFLLVLHMGSQTRDDWSWFYFTNNN